MHNFCYNGQYILHGLSWSLSPPYLRTSWFGQIIQNISSCKIIYIHKQKLQITWKFLNVKNAEWIITHINKKILHTLNVTCMFFLAWYAWLIYFNEKIKCQSTLHCLILTFIETEQTHLNTFLHGCVVSLSSWGKM